MQIKQFLGALVVGLALVSPVSAQTYEMNKFSTDADWNAFYPDGNGSNWESFGAEGRGGNNANNGTYEVGINRYLPGTGLQFGQATAQRTWGNGTDYDFTLTYGGDATKSVTWTIGGTTTSLITNVPGITHLAIRTAAQGSSTISSSLSLYDFALNGVAAPIGTNTTAAAINQSNVRDYLFISGFDATNGFTLTGKARFNWTTPTGNIPGNSNMSFQIKSMFSPYTSSNAPIPEPATCLLVLAVGGVAFARRRRS